MTAQSQLAVAGGRRSYFWSQSQQPARNGPYLQSFGPSNRGCSLFHVKRMEWHTKAHAGSCLFFCIQLPVLAGRCGSG